MDFESATTRELGCWDGPGLLTPFIDEWTTTSTSSADLKPSEEYANALIDIGFGKNCASDVRQFWIDTIQSNYRGDDGRRRARMAAINLRERDGLHGRLFDVKCPVLWLHGTEDAVYSVKNAEREIKMFVNSKDAKLKVVEGGVHFLSFSHPEDVDGAVIEFVGKYS